MTFETFVDRCLAGTADPDAIDDFIDEWHESTLDCSLADFLGFSWDEYELWVTQPDSVPAILQARRLRTAPENARGDLVAAGS